MLRDIETMFHIETHAGEAGARGAGAGNFVDLLPRRRQRGRRVAPRSRGIDVPTSAAEAQDPSPRLFWIALQPTETGSRSEERGSGESVPRRGRPQPGAPGIFHAEQDPPQDPLRLAAAV